MIKDLTFITGNEHKAKQMSRYLGFPLAHHKLDLIEIQSLSLEEIIEHKVKQAYDILKVPVIVDDSSIVFDALNGLPGPFIKYFLQSVDPQQMCDMAHALPTQGAVAAAIIGYYDGKEFKSFLSEVKGKISKQPSGTNGFGFDAFFIPEGFEKPRGELNDEEYDQTSPRKYAAEKFEEYIKTQE